jgi:AraC-like DNA-binding protein
MVRNTLVELIDDTPRPVIALGNDYPDGYVIPPHHHRRGQLLYGASGAIMVSTPQGTWVVPPQRGIWIPGGVQHQVLMLGAVSTFSIYLEAADQEHPDGMPDRCQVVGISVFMRNLMAQALDLPVDYTAGSRAGALMALLQHEMQQLPVLPLALPLPANPALAKHCRQFLENPSPRDTIDDWSQALGMSRRAFTRQFKRETGLSFVSWRQQACLFAALPRLVAGEPVTTVAIDLGYENPASFTTMFKRILGAPPRDYLRKNI